MIRWALNFEDNPTVLMDRILDQNGVAITQALLTSISYRVFEYAIKNDLINDTSGTEIGVSANLTVSAVIFNTLQVDARWTGNGGDSTGYNFRFALPIARLPSGGKFYRVEVIFTPSTAGEEAFKIVWAIETLAVKGT